MQTKEFYDKTAEKYDERHTNYMLTYMRNTEEKLIKKYAHGKVLDIGCGTGQHLHLVNAIGLDISLPMLSEAKKKNHIKLVQGAAENLPFPDSSFNSILCMFTVLNLCEINKAVNEMKRVLKPDGRIIISVTSVWERGNKPLKKKLFRKTKPCRKKMRIEGFRLNFHAFTKEEFISLFKNFKFEYLKGIFIAQNPWWGWHRNFSAWEKIKLRADKLQLINSAARLYLAVFSKS